MLLEWVGDTAAPELGPPSSSCPARNDTETLFAVLAMAAPGEYRRCTREHRGCALAPFSFNSTHLQGLLPKPLARGPFGPLGSLRRSHRFPQAELPDTLCSSPGLTIRLTQEMIAQPKPVPPWPRAGPVPGLHDGVVLSCLALR